MKRINENGRSMVEILGVLAIIGILSLTGFQGYLLAMRRHRANEIAQAVSAMVVLAQSIDSGAGGCVQLSTSQLPKKPGGLDVEIVVTAGESSEPDINIQINDADYSKICEIIEGILPSSMQNTACGQNDIEGCD